MANKVELHPAHYWICENCGRDQFVNCITEESSNEEALEIAKMAGLIPMDSVEFPEDLQGVWMSYPKQVKCKDCLSVFLTDIPGIDGPEDSDG